MRMASIAQIRKARTLPPILLLFGEEEFLVEETLAEFFSEAERRGFTLDKIEQYNCEEITPDEILDRMTAYPLLAEHRILVFRKAEQLQKLEKKKEGRSVVKILEQPVENTHLVFVASLPELNGISRQLNNPKQSALVQRKLRSVPFPFRMVLEEHIWIECPKLYQNEVPSWIAERVSRWNKKITPDAIELLIQMVGYSLRDLHHEIEKLILYTEERGTITAADVSILCGAARQYNIFELQNAIGKRDIEAAVGILQQMMQMQRQELLIVAMLSRFFVNLLKIAQSRTRDPAQLSKITGINAFFIPEYLAMVKNFSESALISAIEILHNADIQLKTSRQSPEEVLLQAVVQILSESR